MASLEYLTHNSLTAYPFKSRVALGIDNPNPIQDSWFLDILFVSYTDTIRGVYISRLEKTSQGDLLVTFNNAESLQPIQDAQIIIPQEEVVNHLQNNLQSFAAYSSNLFAVKFVFGLGLIEKGAFNQTYTLEEAELTSAAVILRTPDIDNLTFESYEDISQGNPTGFVKNYTPDDDTPILKPNYNTTFKLTAVNAGVLDVFPGVGAGLYNACPNLKENVYSVNKIFPDLEGALFLKTTDCYTSNVLSNNDVVMYGQYLDPYKNFVTHMSDDPADDVLFDAVSPQHSIVLENFCRPKCPPENMAAFAYYLNRVTDGVIELDKIVSKNEETHGTGTFVLNIFSASYFCVQNNPFIRCLDPDTGISNINCCEKFIKYYHEGRTLQIYYNNLTIREYTIVEVIDDNTVRLDSAPTVPSGDESALFFRVIDNGVISNVNCAVRAHNQEASTYLYPYFKVKYTTTEAFSSGGVYVTYLAVSLAIFNPSHESFTVRAIFTPTGLTKQGDYKIRTSDTVNIVLDPIVTIPCREYAFIEAIFYIACEQTGGSLEVTLLDNVENLQIGETYEIPNVNGAPCLSTVAGQAQAVRITQTNFANFSKNIPVSNETILVAPPSGDIPSWLDFNYDNLHKHVVLSVKPYQSAPTANAVYNFSYTAYAPNQNTLTFVTVDYVAKPVMVSPTASKYSLTHPLVIAKNFTYSAEEPVFKIFAKNMLRLTGLFASDNDDFFYTISGTLPTGLTFDTAEGTLYGEVDESVTNGSIFNFTLNASNPSGLSTSPQLIYLGINFANVPSISFVSPPEDNVFKINNADTYVGDLTVYAIEVSGGIPSEYVLVGTLIEGLFFNAVTGKITGKALSSISQDINLSLYAKSSSGQSNTLEFTLSYTAYIAPEITSPTNFTEIVTTTTTTTTLGSPLFTVEANNLFGGLDNFDPLLTNFTRNSYTATNLPTGLFIDQYTGKVYGRISSALLPADYALTDFDLVYNVVIYVTNPIGTDLVNVVLSFSNLGLPKITNITVNSKITATRNVEYTQENPLFKIVATGRPSSFSGTGLPEGLICSETGVITGAISSSPVAGEYLGLCTATNQFGTSPTAVLKIVVPLAITYPPNGSKLSLNSDVDYTVENPLLLIQTTGVNNNSAITFTAINLPVGLSLSGNKIIGSVSTAGNFSIKLTANSSFGTDLVYVNLTNDPTYSLSGNITGITVPDGLKISVESSAGLVRYADIQSNAYAISGLLRDTYYLRPNPVGHASHNVNYSFLPSTKSVSLTEDKTGQNFTVSQYHSISGQIIFQKDNITHIDVPIEGVAIDIGLGTQTLTLDDGNYTVSKVPIGIFRITPAKQGYTFTPNYRVVNAIAGTYQITGINFSLQTVQTIAGTIFNPALAKGIPNVTMTLTLPEIDGVVRAASTNNVGLFTLSLAPDKTYRVTPTAQGVQFSPEYADVALPLGQDRLAVDFSASASENIAPSPPAITNVIASYRQLLVQFNPAEVLYPGSAILFYEYSLDNGQTWIVYTENFNQNSIVISQLQDNQQYAVKIRAVNMYSSGGLSNTYIASTPREPESPDFSITPEGTTNTLQIRWQTPQDGGSPILGYKYSLDGGAPVQFSWPYSGAVTRIKNIDSLNLGQTYTLKLLAYNLVGDGIWANEKSIQLCVIPVAPTITSITTGDNSVAIYFTSNNTGGGDLRKTKVRISQEGFVQIFDLNDTTSPIELSGSEYNLYNGYEHDVTIQTANDAGYSAYSNTVTAVPARVPDAPIILSSPKSSSKLIVRYATGEAAPYNGGSAITDYLYSLNGGGYISTGSTVYPIVITQNIVNGVEYTVRIKAVNIKGVSPASEPITQTPNPTAPEEPIIQTVAGSNGQIILNVGEMPADGGFQITGYLYNIIDDLPENYVEGNITLYTENNIIYAQELRPLTITGLNNGQLYTIRLKLKNSIGISSAAIAQGKPVGVPTASTITNVVPGDNKLTCTFTPPTYDGGSPIVNYSYDLYAALQGVGGYGLVRNTLIGASVAPFEITGIDNYTDYAVVLIASNGVYSSSSVRYGEFYPEQRNTHPFGKPFAPSVDITVGNNKLIVKPYNYTYVYSGSNGRRITAIKYVLDTADPVTVIVPNPDNDWVMSDLDFTFTLTGLVNDQEYTLKVAAINEAGAGEFSDNFIASPKAPPSAPTILRVEGRYLYARVYYTPPVNIGKPPILGYVFSKHALASTEPNNPAVTSISYLGNPLLWTKETVTGNFNLPEYGSYTGERLGARSISGVGDTAPLGDIFITSTTPDELIIQTITPNNTKVRFSVITFSDGGHDIADISFSLDGGGVFNPVSNLLITYLDTYTKGYTAVFDVTGLQNNHTYDFVFRASNTLGEGEKSQLVSATPAAQAPPAGGVVYNHAIDGYTITTTSTSLSCLTYIVDDGGSLITNYKYRLNDEPTVYSTTEITDNVVTFSQLNPGQTVVIHLAPENGVGVGEWSSLPETIIAGNPVIQLVSVLNGSGASLVKFGVIDTGLGAGANISWFYESGIFVGLPTDYDYTTGLYSATLYGGNGMEASYTVRATNNFKVSNDLTVTIKPSTVPTITQIYENGQSSGGNIAVQASYDSGGEPVTAVKAVAVPNDHAMIGYLNTYSSLVSAGLTPAYVTYSEDYYNTVVVNFSDKPLGKQYKIFLFLENINGLSESSSIILASQGLLQTPPTITKVEPGASNGYLKIHYYLSLDDAGYGNSAANSITFKLMSGYLISEHTTQLGSSFAGFIQDAVEVNTNDWFSEQEVTAALVNNYGTSSFSSVGVRGYPGRPPDEPEIIEALIVKNKASASVPALGYLCVKVKAGATYGNPIDGYMYDIRNSDNSNYSHFYGEYTRPNSGYVFEGNDRQVFELPLLLTISTLQGYQPNLKLNMFYPNMSTIGGSTYLPITFRASTGSYISVPEPVDFSITEGDKQYSITYQAATINGGALVTSYQYSQNAQSATPTWTTLTVLPGQVFTRTGLINGTTYNVAVRAVNSATTALSSERNFKIIQATPATTPGAPTVGIITGKDRAIAISFVQPINNGATITNFEYSTDGGNSYAALNPADAISPIIISKTSTGTFILNNTTYTIALKAVNRKGSGLASATKSYTVPAGKASEPSLSVTSTKTSLTINYTAPTDNGGAQINGYKYSVAPTGSWSENTATWVQTNNTILPITVVTDSIPGLTIETGQSYTVAVRAVTSFGDGFLALTNKMAAVTPAAGYLLTASKGYVYINNVSIFTIAGVCLYPADSGGSPVTGFEISVNNGFTWQAGQQRSDINLSYGVAFYIPTGISSGDTYQVRCRFLNAVGAGAASNMRGA